MDNIDTTNTKKIVTTDKVVLKFFMENQKSTFTKSDLIKRHNFTTNISRVLKKLEEQGSISKTSIKKGKKWEYAYFLKSADNIEKDLENKIEKIISKNKFPHRSLNDLIKIANESKLISNLFDEISVNDDISKFIFLHRKELFNDMPLFNYIYLWYTNHDASSKSKAIRHIIKSETEFIPLELSNILGLFTENEKESNKIIKEFLDIVFYYLIQMARSSSKLNQLITMHGFSYQLMKEILGEYDDLLDQMNENDMITEPIIQDKIMDLTIQVLSSMVQNIDRVVEELPNMIPNILPGLHNTSKSNMDRLILKLNIDTVGYRGILDDLYRIKVINTKNVFSWCENCAIENPFYSNHIGEIAPSKYLRSQCLNCEKNQSFCAIYALDKLLEEMIFSNDGILAIYLGWLLSNSNVDFIAGMHTDTREVDFIINGSILVECKMLKSGKDEDSINSSLTSMIGQLQHQVSSLENNDYNISKAILLINIDIMHDSSNHLKMEQKEFVKKYKVRIFHYKDIIKFVNSLVSDK